MDSAPLTKELMNRVIAEVYAKGSHPEYMLMDPKPHAGMKALLKFEGRDRRRLKREYNKAWRAERKKELARGIPKRSPSSLLWWANSTATPTSETT